MRETVDVEIRNRTSAMIAENNLVSVRDNIEKNKDKIASELDLVMDDLRTKARLCRGGTKEQCMFRLKKLVPLLHKAKGLRQKMHLAAQQLNLLDAQINAFENGRFQKEMTDTLRAGVVAMRKVGITDDGSDMDTIVLDMEDTMEEQKRLTESMSVSVVNSMDENNSDENMMKELMAMAGNFDEVEELAPNKQLDTSRKRNQTNRVIGAYCGVARSQRISYNADDTRIDARTKRFKHK